MKRLILMLAMCGGAAARADIIVTEATCYEFPPGSGRIICDVTYGLSPSQSVFAGTLPGPPPPEFELFDIEGLDLPSVAAPPNWSVHLRPVSNLGMTGLPDDPQIPNLVFRYDAAGAPTILGPASLGDAHFETLGVPAVQLQYFAARAFDQLTGASVVNGGSFVFVPAPGTAVLLGAGIACLAVRRRAAV